MALVLYTGWDQSLMDTHPAARSVGYEVRQARTQNEVVSSCEEHRFGVAVIRQNGVFEDEAGNRFDRERTLSRGEIPLLSH